MLQPIQLFDLAARQAQWLSVRQSVVAGNIANANTPQYSAQEVTPFNAVMEKTGTQMAATHAMHFADESGTLRNEIKTADVTDEIGVQLSGNTVSLADEMMKSGEIRRAFDLNTGLVKSFHRMMLMTVRR